MLCKHFITLLLCAAFVAFFGVPWCIGQIHDIVPPQEYYNNYSLTDWQSAYFKRIQDSIPSLHEITNCSCPRVYLPICGTNNKTFTNICYMNCLNVKKKRENVTQIKVSYIGACIPLIEPFDWEPFDYNPL